MSSALTPTSTYRGLRYFAAEKKKREAALLIDVPAAKRAKFETGSKGLCTE